MSASFKSTRARERRNDFGAQKLHAEHIGLLPFDVDFAHIDDALQSKPGTSRGGGHAMLAGAGLGDDAGLAHPPRQEDLAHDVVDLVRAGVIEFVALEVDLGAAQMLGQPFGVIERAWPADIMFEETVEFGLEGRIGFRILIGLFQFEDQRHQRLGDEAATINAEEAFFVRSGAIGIGNGDIHELNLLRGAVFSEPPWPPR